MISVAMTTYNGSKYIFQQLDSLNKQSKKVDEVIIVDDASTDDTVNIVNDYIEKNNLINWHLVRNTVNHGYIYSFKKSISKTSGDYIFLCDQDDIWDKNKIKEMVDILDSNSNILTLNCSFQKFFQDNNAIKYQKRLFSSNNNLIRKNIKKNDCVSICLKRVLTYNISPGCTCVFRSELKNIFLSCNLNVPHDWLLNVIAAQQSGLYFYNKELIQYRIHSANTIGLNRQTSCEKRMESCYIFMREHVEMFNYLKQVDNVAQKDLKYLQKLNELLELRYIALKNKSVLKAIKNIFKAVFKYGIIDSCIVDFLSIIKARVGE